MSGGLSMIGNERLKEPEYGWRNEMDRLSKFRLPRTSSAINSQRCSPIQEVINLIVEKEIGQQDPNPKNLSSIYASRKIQKTPNKSRSANDPLKSLESQRQSRGRLTQTQARD